MEQLHNDVNDITNLVRDNLHQIDRRYDACTDLLNAAQDLNAKSKQFRRLCSGENTWRSWWKNHLRTIQIVSIVFSILILLLSFIGLMILFDKN